ncbi:MAG: 30S ribosomal protein S6 [Geminicoccaceae bacterium]
MPHYEHTVIARPDLSSQQAQALGETFGEIIQAQGGTVAKVEYWGLRNLTYRIKKNRKGHYLHLNIDGPPAVIDELERSERIHEDVIRYLSVRVDSLDENPSIIMQVRNAREERGRRDRGDRD